MNRHLHRARNPRRRAFPDIARLLEPGLIGNYEWFEVIEVSCSKDTKFLNVFSVYVAIDGSPPRAQASSPFLNGNDRKVPGINDYSFGVSRRYLTAVDFLDAINRFDDTGELKTSTSPLPHGTIRVSAPAFYAPDGTQTVPLNRVLKNNFWNGSHVIELADSEKEGLQFLLADVKAIAALGVWVRKFITIDIASVADRLGNIIIQFPVTSIAAKFSGARDDSIAITLAWHPNVAHRRVTGCVELSFDEAIVAYGQQQLAEGDNSIVADTTNRPFRGFIWDMEKNILLAAYPPTVFMGEIRGALSSVGSLKRIFYEPDGAGSQVRRELTLRSVEHEWSSGAKSLRPNGAWTERRISDTEIQRLVKLKHFVQYGGSVRGEAEHQRAMADIRDLMDMHGEDAIYLWDPYLSSSDILCTLIHCQHAGSELRALTSSKAIERNDQVESSRQEPSDNLDEESGEFDMTSRERWVNAQNSLLSGSIEEPAHIRLEFRISFGPKGWPFHDRFLIFPKKNGNSSEVWSLGASVNHLGATHAIVQKVAHPQPVVDAFEDLWARIDSAEHLVWISK
ncbi:VPA1262 family N-terminal domain-containing protein [Achromobacter mucicolens]|uniref:VPA1262 family N-terminal domain-containing protein n=1 Tax=Achromobacter mucicolens TaxID=1389922 RepID=UPI0039751B96